MLAALPSLLLPFFPCRPTGDSQEFRDYEWRKHGSCGGAALWPNATAYLATVLALNQQYDLNVRGAG